jgi:hypothetical protein
LQKGKKRNPTIAMLEEFNKNGRGKRVGGLKLEMGG